MKNFDIIKDRYLKEPFDKKLGHLASDLSRIADFLENHENITTVGSVMDESKFFIEWVAPSAPFDIQALLVEMQLKLALWQRRLGRQKESSVEIEDLKKTVKNWSNQLLETSGLAVINGSAGSNNVSKAK